MDDIILGLLLLSDRTIYQLHDRIQKGMHYMYSSSMGSIQAGLKKLLRMEYIAYREINEQGKYKKVYTITKQGRQAFFEWVNSPMEESNVKSPQLVKVYFMGFADYEKRIVCLEQYVSYLHKQYEALKLICDEGEQMQVPKEGKEIFRYQLLSACYGRDLMKFNVEWYEQLLKELREEKQ